MPLPAGLIVAAGGITYPLYLLHSSRRLPLPTTSSCGPPQSFRSNHPRLGHVALCDLPAYGRSKDRMTEYARKVGGRFGPKATVGSEIHTLTMPSHETAPGTAMN